MKAGYKWKNNIVSPLGFNAAILASVLHSLAGNNYGEDPYQRHLDDVLGVYQDTVYVKQDPIEYNDDSKIVVINGNRNLKLSHAIMESAICLHDVLEDTDATEEDLLDFPQEVIDIVKAVTVPKGLGRKKGWESICSTIRDTPGASIVKICDRIANTSSSKLNAPDKYQMYLKEYRLFMLGIFPQDKDGFLMVSPLEAVFVNKLFDIIKDEPGIKDLGFYAYKFTL